MNTHNKYSALTFSQNTSPISISVVYFAEKMYLIRSKYVVTPYVCYDTFLFANGEGSDVS